MDGAAPNSPANVLGRMTSPSAANAQTETPPIRKRHTSGIMARSRSQRAQLLLACVLFLRVGPGGTRPPARLASDNPMAMACLRLVTFLPERPLCSVPSLRSCIARATFCWLFLPYLLATLGPPAHFGRRNG